MGRSISLHLILELARSGIQTRGVRSASVYKSTGLPHVPDIHAFMEPAPADTPEEKQTQPEGNVGSAIGKAISRFGNALASRQAPKLDFTVPQIRQLFGQPQEGAQLMGNLIPTAQPTPARATDAVSAATVSACSATVPNA